MPGLPKTIEQFDGVALEVTDLETEKPAITIENGR